MRTITRRTVATDSEGFLTVLHAWAVEASDPIEGRKPGECFVGYVSPLTSLRPGVAGNRTTRHQSHSLLLLQHPDNQSDITVRAGERWTSGKYAAVRDFSLTEVVHLLLNITDDELRSISSRQTDWRGTPTTY